MEWLIRLAFREQTDVLSNDGLQLIRTPTFGRWVWSVPIESRINGSSKGICITNGHQLSIMTIFQDLSWAARAIRCNRRCAAAQRFYQDRRQPLPSGGQDKERSLGHIGIRVLDEARKAHIVLQTQLPDKQLKLRALPSLAEDDKPRGSAPTHLCKGMK